MIKALKFNENKRITLQDIAMKMTDDELLAILCCIYRNRPNWHDSTEILFDQDLEKTIEQHCNMLFQDLPQRRITQDSLGPSITQHE